MDILIGQRLGKYQIESLVGRGGMAAVYRAHDTVLNRSVAIKVLNPALAIDPRAVERFKREAVTSANLEHPAIVRVFDVQEQGGLYYIAMRYVHGTTLREILRDNGPLPIDAILNITSPVASALHYAHQHGVIHRDVKPGNILVEPDGTVLLTDFGIARAADATQSALTATGQVMGTADYLAPEQITGKPASPRSDVYSLGVVLYEMLTGVTPFSGETTASILYRQVHDNPPPLRSINPRLPTELQPTLDKALAKNPTLRYADPIDLARDLEEAVRWLPPGSPWLSTRNASRAAPGQPTGSQPDGRRGSEPLTVPGPHVAADLERQQGARPASPQARPAAPLPPQLQSRSSRPQTDPIPYMVDMPGVAQQSNEVLLPARVGKRGAVAMVAALLLIIGAVIVAMAAGIIPRPGGPRPQEARFQAPGPSKYSGRLREGNGPDLHASLALAPVSIDGDLSDWAGAEPNPFSARYVTLNKPRWGGDLDLGAQFYFAWDQDNFYVGALITDNLHVQLPTTRGYNLWRGDDVELWLDTDLNGDFTARAANGDDFQLGLSPGNFDDLSPEGVFWNPPPKSSERDKLIKVAARPRPGNEGYTIEAAIAWSAFGDFRPQPGQAIGFVASAGDSDKTSGSPEQELMISTAPTLQYAQPYTFGNLFF